MIFVNLPVSDLQKSIAFYEAVGAITDARFGDASAQMMTLSETIHVMLLTHGRFNSFTTRKIANAHETAQVLLCISEESREGVDLTVGKALAAGATEPSPADEYGFMYGRSFEDPDGHMWGVNWMDVEAAMTAGAEAAV
jgi:predicted lactoylglutathione lyase